MPIKLMTNMTEEERKASIEEGRRDRFRIWCKEVEEVGKQNGLTMKQTVSVLRNISKFQDCFSWAEATIFLEDVLDNYKKGEANG